MDYTIQQLESIACDASRNHCYGGSTAFQKALDFVKKHDEELYKSLLLIEIDEMGCMDELDNVHLKVKWTL